MKSVTSTRRLSDLNRGRLISLGISIHDVDVHSYHYHTDYSTFTLLQDHDRPLVFSSWHGVKAHTLYRNSLSTSVQYSCYSIKGRTADYCRDNGYKLLGAAEDAESLGQLIAIANHKSVLHISTSNRRQELERSLADSNTSYKVCELYYRQENEVSYDKIKNLVVFSPGQFDVIRRKVDLPGIGNIFCLGKTSYNHICSYFDGPIIQAESASENAVIDAVIDFFGNEKDINEK